MTLTDALAAALHEVYQRGMDPEEAAPVVLADPAFREALAEALVGLPIEISTMGDGWKITPKMAEGIVAHLLPEIDR